MDNSKMLFSLYSHQESAITNRTNLMLVAQSFLVVGFVGAISNWLLEFVLATLCIFITIVTIYVGGRELEFFYLVRKELKKEAPIFSHIDYKLKTKWYLNFLGRASRVLCYWLQFGFLAFWGFCIYGSLKFFN